MVAWLINSSLALSALLPSSPPPRAVLLCLSCSAAFSQAWAGDRNLLRPGGAGGSRGGGGGGFIHPTPTRDLYNASRADEQSQEPLTCLHCAVSGSRSGW